MDDGLGKILEQVQALVALGDVRVSQHSYEELAADTIPVHDIVRGLGTAVVVEEYPDYPKGPCALVLEQDGKGSHMGRDVAKEADMSARSTTRLVREGELVAEVDVQLLEADGPWTPYLSLDDAYKLDDVRDALRAGDVKRASQLASRVYRLTLVQV